MLIYDKCPKKKENNFSVQKKVQKMESNLETIYPGVEPFVIKKLPTASHYIL